MLTLILCIGTWPGPSIITWTSLAQAIFVNLAQGGELGELGLVIGVGDAAGPQAVAEAEGDVIGLHDLADLVEALVEEALLWWARHHLAMIEPPRLTMPVTRLAVSGM
jgi:hypothetical protein